MARKRTRARTSAMVITSVVVLAVVIAGFMGYRAHAADGSAADYVTMKVAKGDVDQYLDLSGTVSESNQSSVGFPTSGTVTSVDVALGDTVKAGQKLATMDDSSLELAVTQAKADLASAKDDLAKAENSDSSDSTRSSSATTTGSGSASQGTGSDGTGSQSAGSQGSASQHGSSPGTASQDSAPQASGAQQDTGTERSDAGSQGGTQAQRSSTGVHGSGSKSTTGSASNPEVQRLQQQVTGDAKNLAKLQAAVNDDLKKESNQCSDLRIKTPTASSSPSESTTAPSSSPSGSTTTPSSTPSESTTTPSTPAESTTPSQTSSSPETSSTPNQSPSSDSPSPSPSEPNSATPSDTPTADADSVTTGQNADFTFGSAKVEGVDDPTDSSTDSQLDQAKVSACLQAMQQTADDQRAVTSQQSSNAENLSALSAAVQKAAQSASSATTRSGQTFGNQETESTTGTGNQTSGSQTSGNQASGGKTMGAASGGKTTGTGNAASGSNAKTQQPSGGTGANSLPSGSGRASGSGSPGTAGGTGQSRGTGNGGSGAPTSSGSAAPLSGSSAGQGTTTTVAEDKASLTSAKISLKLAEKQLREATISSPMAGVVASLDFAKGDSVSTSEKIVITGAGATVITVDVPGTKLDSIKKGQQATVGTKSSAGEVSTIGLLPSSDSSSSDASYPVSIRVADPRDDLADGTTTSVQILVSRFTDVVQVPVSAVTLNGSSGTVTILKDGQPQRTRVQVGAIGSTTVQIASGLTVGESVVIADRSQPLPSSNSSTTTRGLSAGGGFGGRAETGGGFPGGSGTGRR